MKTKFLVMNEGRLVFDGSETELRAPRMRTFGSS